MENVKVSIIIPCCDIPEEYLARALASVRSQTFRDYEVIVVDDGSREPYASRTEQLCRDTAKAERIRIPHSGVSAARNAGVRQAKGDYIAFLDADDVLAADFLERALKAAEETKADFVIGGLLETDCVDVPFFPPRTGRTQYEEFTGENLHQIIGPYLLGLRSRISFPGGYINSGPVSRLIRSGLSKELLFDTTLSIGEDLVWNLQLLKKCRRVCVVRETWYGYWKNPQSAVHRYQPEIIEECRKQIERITEIINTEEPFPYSSYADQIYVALRLFWFNYLSHEKRENRDHYRKLTHRLYTEWPWKEIGTERYYAQVGRIKKITAVLYRLHLFYTGMDLKERILPSDVCGGRND